MPLIFITAGAVCLPDINTRGNRPPAQPAVIHLYVSDLAAGMFRITPFIATKNLMEPPRERLGGFLF
ncbi:hypothetical protein AG1IA_04290 [Rhizoctonia solani AG-1 IA]|uniref:Uncharacterized protein n=1 Tax=Thanatephorus cucumeris (strain AG1-IA) TaxID=983506 RepID=L8WXW7_THACA|nr:hypothetical protein AG1IA_04290 [Rhizoctonia solani AG-1 IA]